MNEKEKYATQWNSSSEHFYRNCSYKHLSNHIKNFLNVLEIGCGTGQSTLSLLESGHSVIAVDKNPYCLARAKSLILKSGYNVKDTIDCLQAGEVYFLECDVTDSELVNLQCESIDIVVCWNIGTYWDENMINEYLQKIKKYGLTTHEFQADPESSYCELIIWNACKIAKSKNCGVHIAERGTQKITKNNDPYYSRLKKEFGFQKINYINMKSTTLSNGGRPLVTQGVLNTETELPIVFLSILLQ